MIKIIKKHEMRWLMPLILIGLIWFTWTYFIDGVYANRVITFSVDPMNIQLEKEEYKPGELVYGYTAFCKNREARGITEWHFANEILHSFTKDTDAGKSLPIGCYGEDEPLLFAIKRVPLNAHKNEESFFTADVTHLLPDGRTRKQTIKTEEFTVSECARENLEAKICYN